MAAGVALTLIDYGDLTRPCGQWRDVYEVTEEFYVHLATGPLIYIAEG